MLGQTHSRSDPTPDRGRERCKRTLGVVRHTHRGGAGWEGQGADCGRSEGPTVLPPLPAPVRPALPSAPPHVPRLPGPRAVAAAGPRRPGRKEGPGPGCGPAGEGGGRRGGSRVEAPPTPRPPPQAPPSPPLPHGSPYPHLASDKNCLRRRAGELEAGSRIPDPGSRMPDARCRIPDPRSQIPTSWLCLPTAPGQGGTVSLRDQDEALSRKGKLYSRDVELWESIQAASWRCPSRLSGGQLWNMLVWTLWVMGNRNHLYLAGNSGRRRASRWKCSTQSSVRG